MSSRAILKRTVSSDKALNPYKISKKVQESEESLGDTEKANLLDPHLDSETKLKFTMFYET